LPNIRRRNLLDRSINFLKGFVISASLVETKVETNLVERPAGNGSPVAFTEGALILVANLRPPFFTLATAAIP
jgi:hypothetical protein